MSSNVATITIEEIGEAAGYLHARLEILTAGRQPAVLRVPEVYLTANGAERFHLYALQYGFGTESRFFYEGGKDSNGLHETYVLPPSTRDVRLTFRKGTKDWPRDVTIYLEGLSIGGEDLQVVYQYRVDCEALRKEVPRVQIWLGLGVFNHYCSS